MNNKRPQISIMNIDQIIRNAINEDLGDGDHSSLACISKNAVGKAKLIIKDNGILCGVSIAQKVFQNVDQNIRFTQLINDGASIRYGDVAFTVEGSSISLLSAERLALNFMQRMSGIATTTDKYVQLIKGTKTKLLDTRKTTPNLRQFEKMAVKIGGGVNHRFGLFDMIMLKDNHIDLAGGVSKAIQNTLSYLQNNTKDLKIVIEARDMSELSEIMSIGGVHRIMLDNFSPDEIIEAIKLIDGKYETEASGGITIDTIRSYAETGVDFISVGALTHNIKSLDMSLKAIH